VIHRFTLDAACEFLFNTKLQTLDSTLAYPHIKPGSGDHTSSGGISPEEAFSRALVGAETVLMDRFNCGELWCLQEFFKDKSESYMEVINEFLNPILEECLAKHAARDDAGEVDDEEKTLLDSLLQKTTGCVTPKLHRSPSY
jgi:hypothetical protein